MTDIRPRLWETPRIGAELFDADPSHMLETAERLASEITIVAGDGGFAVSNASSTDVLVLVTLMAKATGSSTDAARARLSLLTTAVNGDYWREDVQLRQRPTGQWVATRSGMLLLPLGMRAQSLVSQRTPERGGVVVAAVAAVADGVAGEAGLMGVAQGAFAVIGERPAFV